MTIEDNGKSEEIESDGVFLPWEHLTDGSREDWGWFFEVLNQKGSSGGSVRLIERRSRFRIRNRRDARMTGD